MTVIGTELKSHPKKTQPHGNNYSRSTGWVFRTYVRYETEKHEAPVSVLIKIAPLGNILLDRLLTTTLTLESLEMPNKKQRKLKIFQTILLT